MITIKIKVVHIPDGRKGNPYQELLAQGLKSNNVDVRFIPNGFKSLLLSAFKNNANVLHIHWIHSYIIGGSMLKTIIKGLTFIFILLVFKIKKIRIFWTVHNLKNHENKQLSLELFFSRLIARLADVLLVHGENGILPVCTTFKVKREKIRIIPHGNYEGVYNSNADTGAIRKKLGISKEDLVLLYFGQIREYKGIPELVVAFNKVNTNARLIIAGKPYLDETKTYIGQLCLRNPRIITFLKFIPDNELAELLKVADVVILPYRDIFTSGSLLLALTFGRPVITPRIGLIPEYVDNSCAFLYDPKDRDGLYKALLQVLKCRSKLEIMSRDALTRAKRFSWEHIGTKLADLYKKSI